MSTKRKSPPAKAKSRTMQRMAHRKVGKLVREKEDTEAFDVIPKTMKKKIEEVAVGGKIDAERLFDVAGLNEESDPGKIAAIEKALLDYGIKVVDTAFDEEYKVSADADIDHDPLRIYLRDVSRIPLLNADEERRLAKEIRDSIEVIKKVRADSGLSDGELRKYHPDYLAKNDTKRKVGRRRRKLVPLAKKLIKAEQKFAEAQRKLIEANLRLVISIARRYSHHGLHLLDLINEGNLGLIKAIERFDYRKGFKFSTYASWWIMQAIRRAIADQGRIIRVPVHMVDSINRWIKVSRLLAQRYGREPTLAEMAAEMGVSEPKLLEIMKVGQEPSSLEAPLANSQGSSLGDIVEDTAQVTPFRAVMALAFSEHMTKMLSTLQEKERKVIELRFGLGGREELTLEDVGNVMKITRERVRQLETRALRKLRHTRLAEELFSMIEDISK